MALWGKSLCPNCGQKATGWSCPCCGYPLMRGKPPAEPPSEKPAKKLAERKPVEARQEEARIRQETKKKAEPKGSTITAQAKPEVREMVKEVSQQVKEEAEKEANAVIAGAAEKVEQAEKALRRSEANFRKVIAKNADGIVIVNRNGIVLFSNPAVESLFGRKAEELMGELFGFPTVAGETTEIDIIRKGGEACIAEMRVVETEWEGETAYMASIRDITERKRAEEKLIEGETRLKLAIEALESGIWELNVKTGKAWRSLRHDQIFGYTTLLPEWNYQMFLDHVIPEDRSEVDSKYGYALSTNTEWDFECRISRVDKAVRWIWAHGKPSEYDDKNEVVMITGIVRDITERKQAEKALRRSEANFRKVIAKNADGIVIVNRNGIVLFSNPAVESLFGRKAEELMGELFGFPTVAGETTEIDIIRKGGEACIAEMRVVETEWEGETAYMASIRDITEHKRAEEVLEMERKRLEREDKEKVEFIGVISHELKTPLTSVVAAANLLSEELSGEPDSPRARLIKSIQLATQSMEDRLDELLNLAKMGIRELMIQPMPLDVRQLLEGVVEQFRPIAQKQKQTLIFESPLSLPKVKADPQRLEQVLLNLLTNASKFSPEDSEVAVRAQTQNGNVVVEVKDNGPGISKESQDRIFELYYRTEADRQRVPGLGLGLALSKRLIEEQKGKLWLNSELGKGSIFSFSLPSVNNGK